MTEIITIGRRRREKRHHRPGEYGNGLNKTESFEKVVEAVHQRGGKIALQILSHMGIGFAPDVDAPAASVVPKEMTNFS